MTIRKATLLLFCFSAFFSLHISAQNVPGYNIKVPQEMEFAGLKLLIDDFARSKIQKDVNRLLSSQQHLNILTERTFRFFPVIEKVLDEEKVPTDFKFLSIQESALLSDAVSSSNAVGYWQFKRETALEMGIWVNDEVDERKNIMVATRGAAKYLRRNQIFTKNWIHTLLSYNLGLTGVRNTIQEGEIGTERMDIDGNTHWYILRCLAHKLVFEEVLKSRPKNVITLLIHPQANGMTLAEVGQEMNIPLETLRLYNKWLSAERVPMNRIYHVVIPVDIEQLPVASAKIPPEPPPVKMVKNENPEISVAATVKKEKFPIVEKGSKAGFFIVNGKTGIQAQTGDTPEKLAARAHVALHKFLDYNDLPASAKILAGQVYYLRKKNKSAQADFHTAQYGETLLQIAQKYGIRHESLLSKNRMERSEKLQPGRVLYLRKKRPKKEAVKIEKVLLPTFKKPEPAEVKMPVVQIPKADTVSQVQPKVTIVEKPLSDKTTHMVAEKETLFSIARFYKIDVNDLRKWNNLSETDNLQPGQTLKLTATETITLAKEEMKEHKVQPGDSLFKLAWDYNTTVQEIMEQNGKTEPKIRIGEKLKIKANSKKQR
jgi:membrane-bound lytic murein transglycosylase D